MELNNLLELIESVDWNNEINGIGGYDIATEIELMKWKG